VKERRDSIKEVGINLFYRVLLEVVYCVCVNHLNFILLMFVL
jgi:hypothetical protein